MEIRELRPDDADGCDRVIASLPQFFGDPDGVRDCAAAVRSQRGLVAVTDERILGFLTIARHFDVSAEITWMAVHADARRRGVGRQLVEAVTRALSGEGVRALSVLTLGPSVPEPGTTDGYEGTRRFYRSVGFVPLRELGLRDWNDAATLMLVRPL